MNLVKLLMSALLMMSTGPALSNGSDIYPFNNLQNQQRFIKLTNDIRCIVCQGQSLAESNASLAKDLRQIIYDKIQAHENDEQIKNYLTHRYGDFILLEPRFTPNTLLLWLFPLMAIFSSFFIILRGSKKP